jgi:hypothetical protein
MTPRLAASIVAVATLFLAACSAPPRSMPPVPPIAADGPHLPGKIVWHDLLTPDLPAAQAFYGGLFGWTFDAVAPGYVVAHNGGRPVAGLAQLRHRNLAYWVPQVSVTDVDAAAAATRRAGGAEHLPPTELPGRGRVAVLGDPRGAPFGVIRASRGDPSDRPPAIHDWLWTEVWSDDVEATAGFYRTLLGYADGERTVDGQRYRYLQRDGAARLGLLVKPDAALPNAWVGYVRVADPAATARRARELGGRVLLEPRPDLRQGRVAVLADPTGGTFIVQQRPQ